MPGPDTAVGAGPGSLSGPQWSQVQGYDSAYQSAAQELRSVQENLSQAINAYNQAPEPLPGQQDERKLLESRIQSLQTAYNAALADRQRAAEARAKGYEQAYQQADPQTQALVKAKVDGATTDAQKAAAELEEWKGTADNRKAEVAAKQRLSSAQADKVELDNAFQKETDPQRKALLQAQIQKATQDVTDAQQASSQAAALLPGRLAQQGADLGQTTAQTGLVGAQTASQEAGTARTNALTPGEVAQQGATLGETNARTGVYNQQAAASAEDVKAKQLGPLYGLQQRITQIQQDFKDGKLSTLPDPSQLVSDYYAAAVSGTTPFDAFKNQQAEQDVRTGQQISQRDIAARLQGQKATAFGSVMGQSLQGAFDANKYLPPGSPLAGQAAGALLNASYAALSGPSDSGSFGLGPTIPSPNAPSYLDQYRGAQPPAQAATAPPPAQPATPAPAPAPAPAAQPAAPAPDTGGGHTITINIGGSGGSRASGGEATGGPAPNAPQGAAPAYLANQQLATPQHVAALFGRAA